MSTNKYSIIKIADVMYCIIKEVHNYNEAERERAIKFDFTVYKQIGTPDLSTSFQCHFWITKFRNECYLPLDHTLEYFLHKLGKLLERTNDRDIAQAWDLLSVRLLMEV